MKVFYDTEFIEDGSTIELISIGMVTDDGREYYAVASEIDDWGSPVREQLHQRISKHDWLMANVVPDLPLAKAPTKFERNWHWSLDKSSTLVKPRWVIANEVRAFILGTADEVPYVELWADYAAYDHVALCQLWGTMMRLPEGIPMWTHDLRQEAERHGVPGKQLPALGGTAHNALDDAREVAYRYGWLQEAL